ncbi:MAG TPA: hypothetical protein VNE39_10575 [Planctomycetota bacterium]|nr:hypothetical protein [Planctomycetota bacterium]
MRRLLTAVLFISLAAESLAAEKLPAVDKARLRLFEAWHALPVPPITPYSGPFTGEARAFVGKVPPEVQKAFFDWKRQGTYDPDKDPRPINTEFEAAMLDEWRRMGYNAAYKGHAFTYRVGRFLKKHGMLGAIDQTLWNATQEGATHCDGTKAPRPREACGSFLAPANHDEGVRTLVDFVTHHGEPDMVKVGDTYLTCSWDEVGMRTRATIDYRPEAIAEYRRFLADVWFADRSPDRDTNRDGRTYNAFTGETLTSWDDVTPPILSPRFYSTPQPVDEKWSRPGAYKLWMDFHRYYTFEFFRRINEEASAKLGKRVECYPFPQAFIVWPGMDCFWGMSVYWNARLNPVITNEQCWPDSPAMAVNYAQTDRLARRWRNPIMGWSWFYFADEARDFYDRPGDIERALARMMGHRVDGIHHWLYCPQYRGRHQVQRQQLAYWHNFLAKHYRSFLADSAPPPAEVALLLPDYTGYFYRMYTHPKVDYAYTAQALVEAQIPFEIVAEEEIELEPDALAPYKALYIVASEWTTPTIRQRVSEFIARGGHVFLSGDSLSLDIPTGRRTDFLAETFGIRLQHKAKNPFFPSTQTPEEEAWGIELGKALPAFQHHDLHKPGVVSKLWKLADGKPLRDEDAWTKLDAAMAKLPAKGRGGIEQSPIDMRTPPVVRYEPSLCPAKELTTYGEINTGAVTKGKPVAWHGDRVCGVETERTLWLGTRPGMDMHAIAPRMPLSRTTEPCNPFLAEVSDNYRTHKPYVDLVACSARKAGVKPLVQLSLQGEVPCNLEVLPRVDDRGNLMVFVVNHDATEAAYDVAIDPAAVPKRSVALNLLKGETIEEATDGKFKLAVPPWRVAVFFVGAGQVLKRVQAAQAELAAMDLSVPEHFRKRPELNEGLWHTPVPAK